MKQYTVSGCIVTHNNMKTIKATLESLFFNTKGVDFKLFIVDNSSTDGTVDFIRKNFCNENIEIIETGTNYGFGAGHNVVLDKLHSKYHVIINPDIILTSDVLAVMTEYLDNNEDIGLLSPRICFPDGREQILGKRNPKLKYLIASRFRNETSPGRTLRKYAMLDQDLTKPIDIENATGCFMMIKTELFKAIGGFDENYFMYFEDCDLTRTVKKQARTVYYPQAVISHVWGRESKKNFKLKIIQIKSMLYYFWKWKLESHD